MFFRQKKNRSGVVSVDAYPLAYEIFEGKKFEGYTMLPAIEAFKQQYGLGKLVVIADSGLLSKQNIEQLQSQGYEFILGARIKNEPAHIQEQILSLRLKNSESATIEKPEGIRRTWMPKELHIENWTLNLKMFNAQFSMINVQ